MTVLRPLWAVADSLDVPRRTVQTWARRLQVTSACDVRTRAALVDAGEAMERATRRRAA